MSNWSLQIRVLYGDEDTELVFTNHSSTNDYLLPFYSTLLTMSWWDVVTKDETEYVKL